MKFETISDLFKSPLPVTNRSGEIEELDLDPLREPQLLIVDEPPMANDVPVTRVKYSDGVELPLASIPGHPDTPGSMPFRTQKKIMKLNDHDVVRATRQLSDNVPAGSEGTIVQVF